jgi:UDP-N-acetylglucosamine acyltransferase
MLALNREPVTIKLCFDKVIMQQHIHPSAYIETDVVLGDNVHIGAFAVIESGVEIGANCQIDAHAVIRRFVKMGCDNHVHPHAVLGDLPQDIHFKSETVSWLKIGDGNVFREGFTAHRASVAGGETRIGSGGYFMNHSHIAHDCVVGDHSIFANAVAIGGFVEVGDRVFMGGAAVVHQFCRIGSYAMIQGTSGLNKDVIPYTLVGGRPAKHYRLNTLGLRRGGITGERYRILAEAFRLLKRKQSLDSLEETDELRHLKQWLAAPSKRGIQNFIELVPTDEL